MKLSTFELAAAIATLLCVQSVDAAFIVEADHVAVAGKAHQNFEGTPAGDGVGYQLSSAFSSAAGLQANQSAFGNPANATGPDRYVSQYTPGTDVDNTGYTVGQVLGNSEASDSDGLGAIPTAYATVNQLATGKAGGRTGYYNVYFTTPTSTNVNGLGSNFVTTHDGGSTDLSLVNQNDNFTGPDTTPPGGAHVGGANNMWLKIASMVHLTAGVTYTVTQTSNAAFPDFVSQRHHGVMWEFVIVPEPSTFVLAALACFGLIGARRRVA